MIKQAISGFVGWLTGGSVSGGATTTPNARISVPSIAQQGNDMSVIEAGLRLLNDNIAKIGIQQVTIENKLDGTDIKNAISKENILNLSNSL
jgi:hypothetical protein